MSITRRSSISRSIIVFFFSHLPPGVSALYLTLPRWAPVLQRESWSTENMSFTIFQIQTHLSSKTTKPSSVPAPSMWGFAASLCFNIIVLIECLLAFGLLVGQNILKMSSCDRRFFKNYFITFYKRNDRSVETVNNLTLKASCKCSDWFSYAVLKWIGTNGCLKDVNILYTKWLFKK